MIDIKIIIIGPVYPYKGGIAHYTSLMAKNLQKEHDIHIFSFKLQYPKFLYKGREQQDPNNDYFKFENTQYLINTINPISYIATANAIKRYSPDLIIVQWWHPFFAPAYWSILKLLGGKYKILFLCHNVLPHEKFPFQKFLVKTTLKYADAYILHSKIDEDSLKQLIKKPKYKRVVHPNYNTFNIGDTSSKKAREILMISDDSEVLLFFGFIREYKGLKHLIRALPMVAAKLPQCKLLVVGDFFENNKEEYLGLIKACGCEEQILLYDGYTPDKEVGMYFNACDLVVLPYESATQSGIVQIAYSFEKPVIATSVGGLPEVVLDGKTGYVVPPMSDEHLANAIIKFFQINDAQRFKENIKEESYKYSWDRMNETVNMMMEYIISE